MKSVFVDLCSSDEIHEEDYLRILTQLGYSHEDAPTLEEVIVKAAARIRELEEFKAKFSRSKGRPSKYGLQKMDLGERKIFEMVPTDSPDDHREYSKRCGALFNAVNVCMSRSGKVFHIDHNEIRGCAVVTRTQ